MSLPEIKEWHVETLRLTLFSTEAVNASGRGWWKSVVQVDPESILNRQSAGEYSESGEFLGGQFDMRVVFNRVDWILSYPFSDMPGAPAPGDFSVLVNKWLQLLKSWLDNVEFPVTRIAAGAVLLKKTESGSAGNALLGEYFQILNIGDPDAIADLLLQANSPVMFKSVDGLRHNRISKMAVLDRQMITIGPAGFPTTVVDTVLRNELDMSSAVDNFEHIPSESLHPLTVEMADAFMGILQYGLVNEKIQ